MENMRIAVILVVRVVHSPAVVLIHTFRMEQRQRDVEIHVIIAVMEMIVIHHVAMAKLRHQRVDITTSMVKLV